MLEQTTADAQRQRLAQHQGKQVFGSAEQAMKSLEQSTATINTLINNNEASLNSGLQGLISWARRSMNCARR
jgi:phospholipid/cholesterol/gamma-HCH transport system substrate-binding protein